MHKPSLLLLTLLIHYTLLANSFAELKRIKKLYEKQEYSRVLDLAESLERPKNDGNLVGANYSKEPHKSSAEFYHYKLSSFIYLNGLDDTREIVRMYDRLLKLDTEKRYVHQEQYQCIKNKVSDKSVEMLKTVNYREAKRYLNALARWGDTTEAYHTLYQTPKTLTFNSKSEAKMFFVGYDDTEMYQHAKSVQSDDLEALVWLLTHKYEFDHEKMRVIFLWIQHNISYDYTYRSYTYYSTFKSRKGICAGYSDLIDKMFCYAKLDANLVIGDADNGNPNRDLHAWTQVNLGGYDFWIDATWGYFLVEPSELKSHTAYTVTNIAR